MSRIRTNVITNRMANGAPTVSNGLVISGVTTTSDIKVGTGVTLNVYGGATFSGIVTAPSFSGGITGNVTGNVTGNIVADNGVFDDFVNVGSHIQLGNAGIVTAKGFVDDGTKADIPTVNNITAGVVTATTFSGNITGTTASFTGDVGIGGTLTYEDVTNIDSVGIITARAGINVTGGNVTVGGKALASTGKAIAMAMVFG